uniref:Rv3235 family protein n=2 Tax=Actinomycetaceae TaxID=2049 RepID=UPI0002003632
MTATTTAQAIRPARRKTGAQRRSRPSPSHPTPTRAVPHKPSKPVNGSEALARETSLTRRSAAGADASRTAAIVVTAASEVLAGLRPVDHLVRWTSPSL